MPDEEEQVYRPGVAVDSRGGAVIDPTKNVLDLVRAESKYQDAMRDALQVYQNGMRDALKDNQDLARMAEAKFQNFAREMESKFQSGILSGETRRVDQLASLRQDFQNTIRDMLAESVRTTSTLVSTQLVQIQATFDTRVSKLEAGAFIQAGRSSVADPAMSDSLVRLTASLAELRVAGEAAQAKTAAALNALQSTDVGQVGRITGMKDTNARFFAIVMAIAAVAGPMIAVFGMFMAMRGK